jgi:D-serine deaminase-like pyridoxal phosphate-dependent protein
LNSDFAIAAAVDIADKAGPTQPAAAQGAGAKRLGLSGNRGAGRAERAGARPRPPCRGRTHLAFAGLQAYHCSAQHLRGWEERRQAIVQAVDKAGRTRDLLARNGIECPTVTGAGTGSLEFETGSGSIPSCNAAPTSLWTPITGGTTTATARRPRPLSRAFLFGRQ